MFKKPHCSKCKKDLKKDFDFCPYCGASQNQNNNWGMLGKNDFPEAPIQNNDPFSQLLPGLSGGIFNKMLGNAMKMVENELQREMQQSPQGENVKRINLKPNTKLQLFINGKPINLEGNSIPNPTNQTQSPQKKQIKKQPKKLITKDFTPEMKEKFSTLQKEEPQTSLRRLSSKVIYELNMPGVKSIDNVAIRNLEKSIEIKAIGKTKAYYKIIAVDLPLLSYSLEKDVLVLELEARG